MLGSSLEALTLAWLWAFKDYLGDWGEDPPQKQAKRGLMRLIKTITEHGWLPAAERKVEIWGGKFVSFSECLEMLRRCRNLVHPGLHGMDGPCRWPDRGVFADCHATVMRARKHLGTALSDELDSLASQIVAFRRMGEKRFGLSKEPIPEYVLCRVQGSTKRKNRRAQGPMLFK
jgi:hypothetical protein